jgi:gliding motility-associated-like protein
LQLPIRPKTRCFGCSDSIDRTFTISTRPKADFTYTISPCTSTVTFKNTSLGAHSILWNTGDGFTNNKDSFTQNFQKDTSVKIMLIAEPGSPCADTLTRFIKFVWPKAGFEYTVDTCSGLVHFINRSEGTVSYLWNFTARDTSTKKDPDFTYFDKGQYPVKLLAVSQQGCKDSIVKNVSIDKDFNLKIFIPNVFTPNNDGINNKFVVRGLSGCYDYDLRIYNRWGQEMLHAKGKQLVWDGYYDHKLVAEGEYYYVFQGKKEGQLKGTITVLY